VFDYPCWPGNEGASIDIFVCTDAYGKNVGDMQFQMDFTAKCYNEMSDADSCQEVTNIINLTKTPSPPAPVPKDKWVPCEYSFIPKDVIAALGKYSNEVPTLKKYPGAQLRPPTIYKFGAFCKVSSSGTAYKVDVSTSTKSLAKNCYYPYMYQKVQVAIEKAAKGGALTKLPNETKLEKIKVADGSEDDAYPNIKCLSSPAFKAALAQAKKFAASN
jgi:hypothetical protein